ncbi:MAG: nucleotidyltransferase domain-containing protein [Ignavibacteria bacterium]
MRLKENELSAIKKTISGFDPKAKIFLFGSRTDDEKKGGDIDVLILSEKINLGDKIKILKTLNNSIGEQKIDIVIAKDDSKPFIKLALEKGVEL